MLWWKLQWNSKGPPVAGMVTRTLAVLSGWTVLSTCNADEVKVSAVVPSFLSVIVSYSPGCTLTNVGEKYDSSCSRSSFAF